MKLMRGLLWGIGFSLCIWVAVIGLIVTLK